MDDTRFDALIRALGNGTSRRGALSLIAGAAGLGLGEVVAKRRKHGKGRGKGKGKSQKSANKSDHKVTICHLTGSAANPVVQLEVDESAIPDHQAHGDAIDPDFQTDVQNCGSCGTVCTGGGECSAAACQQGRCGTTPTPGTTCDSGTGPDSGTCDAEGKCQPNTPHVCSGQASSNPCFPRDASICGTNEIGTTSCRCGTDLDGNLTCYENAYCNDPRFETLCASNADCEAKGFGQGSVCFSAENCCLGGPAARGCTTPCPAPSTN